MGEPEREQAVDDVEHRHRRRQARRAVGELVDRDPGEAGADQRVGQPRRREREQAVAVAVELAGLDQHRHQAEQHAGRAAEEERTRRRAGDGTRGRDRDQGAAGGGRAAEQQGEQVGGVVGGPHVGREQQYGDCERGDRHPDQLGAGGPGARERRADRHREHDAHDRDRLDHPDRPVVEREHVEREPDRPECEGEQPLRSSYEETHQVDDACALRCLPRGQVLGGRRECGRRRAREGEEHGQPDHGRDGRQAR
nr:hypothetical protein [Nocardioides immobilis]